MKIKNNRQHAQALERIEKLMGHKAVKELDALSIAASEYEAKRWPILPPTPREAMAAKIAELEVTQSRMAYLLGMQKGHFSEFMTGKRNLPIEAIRIAIAEYNMDPFVLLEIS